MFFVNQIIDPCSGRSFGCMLGGSVDALRTAFFSSEEGCGAFEDEVRAEVFGADFVVGCESLRGSALEDRVKRKQKKYNNSSLQ